MADTDTHNSIMLLNADGTGEEYGNCLSGGVTPTPSVPTWQQWIEAGGLSTSYYSSLDDVLADEKAIRQLMTIHASVDYLASITESYAWIETIINDDYCAKWINLRDYALDTLHENEDIAALMDEADKYFYGEWTIVDSTTTPVTWGPKGNVPVMTSNTAPYGEASATNASSGYEAYRAFSDAANSMWVSTSTANAYIQYKSVNPINVKRVSIRPSLTGKGECRVNNWKYQVSNDGTTFVDVYSGVCEASETPQIFYIQNDNYYLYHRILVIDTVSNNTICIQDLQFYGRELKVSVPTMTSDTLPFGEVVHSPVYQTLYGWYPFSRNAPLPTNAVCEYGFYSTGSNRFCGYDFGRPVQIKKIVFQASNQAGSIGTGPYTTQWSVSYSIDGDTWTELDGSAVSVSTLAAYPSAPQVINCDVKAKAVRIIMIASKAPYLVYANFYGLDYSEYDWDEENPRTYLYDHGLNIGGIAKITVGPITAGELNFNEDNVSVYAKDALTYVGVGKVVDLTNYKDAFASCVATAIYESGSAPRISVRALDNSKQLAAGNAPAPLISRLDLSSFNGDYIISYFAYSAKGYATEIWLE